MNSSKPDFTFLDHTADLGILVKGTDLKDLFEVAARSMMYIMVKENPIQTTDTVRISVAGQDLADLMVRWLSEILYMLEGEHVVVRNVRIAKIVPSHLNAILGTVPFDPAMHEILCEIKAVTYHQIEVVKNNEHWEAKIIFDL
jgi:SHS2 domain-containing protein